MSQKNTHTSSDDYLQSQRYLLSLLNAARIARCLEVIAQLGIADLLQEGPKSITELAAKTQTNEQALYRVLRALASVDVFTESSSRHFSLTPQSVALVSQLPGSVAGMAKMMGAEWFLRSFDLLDQCLRTGDPVISSIYGVDLWTYFRTLNPQAGRQFDTALTGTYAPINALLAQSYDFSAFKTLVDVGGGQGQLLFAILQQHTQIQGILFDRLEVVQTISLPSELTGRVEVIGGDFFQALPAGASTYLLRQVLHDHDDTSAVQILEQCRMAMLPTSRVLIIERVIGQESSPADLFLDVQLMLLMPGARERTKEEFAVLCEHAGLTLTSIIPTPSPFSILEAKLIL